MNFGRKKYLLFLATFLSVSCGPALKTERVSLSKGDDLALTITDKWVLTDTKNAVKEIMDKMSTHKGLQRYISGFTAKGKLPKLFIMEVNNQTSEPYFPVDDFNDEFLQSISESGDFTLIDNKARANILKELKYQNDGMVDPQQAKSIGKMSGADLLIFGDIRMKPETLKGRTIKEYTVNLRMTNLQSGEEVWRARYNTQKYSERKGSSW
ncbi:MAG: penicillin-binding protein activator LpoB [Rickettsiales bacterium]|jgi:PBP1b-binding outer membrane lipoprotein LpoB|nr:penicillin-binding protein activator LpoB [Rickettsiales bacterium]